MKNLSFRFEIRKEENGEWYWSLFDIANKLRAESSEGFENETACIDFVNTLKSFVPQAEIYNGGTIIS